MQEQNPSTIYQQQKDELTATYRLLKKKQNMLGWLRLFIILATVLITYLTFSYIGVWGWLVVAIGIMAFLLTVSKDANNNNDVIHTKSLITINEEELNVLSNNFHDRFDGTLFQPTEHPYAGDIDVFGKASLYQLINRCETEKGRSLLANNFLFPIQVPALLERQAAVQELAPMLQWRQAFQATAIATPLTLSLEKRIIQWMDNTEKKFDQSFWQWLLPVYSAITISTAIATILDYIPGPVFSGLFLLYFLIGLACSKHVMKGYMQLSGVVKEVDTLSALIQHIEQPQFNSPLLVKLQKDIYYENRPASRQIKDLKEILNRFDLRLNVFVFMVLNSFLLWDVRQMRALNNWKETNASLLPKTFPVIAEFEVLNSLATLHFNQPAWAFPAFEEFFTLHGNAIGHPLLAAANRVTSDFELDGKGKIALITGSNMAGKSTFLRSLGVNVVLAQMGAPVCATAFTLAPMQLMSSMRIADNLAENTSTFYAELKKLEMIITAVKQHRPLFILLDEILRGTNSLDRHIGSKALIGQLIREKAVGIIATHDVELTELKEEYQTAIENYHFDVQVDNGELYFDYKLKHGVCTSLNASILMKKIGIEL